MSQKKNKKQLQANKSIPHYIIVLLKCLCVSLFVGRAWQHLRWDAPYRTLLWDENLLHDIVENMLNISWQTYVSQSDIYIQNFIVAIGVLYLFFAVVSILAQNHKPWQGNALKLGSVMLLFLALLYYKEKFYQIGQLIEYALQIGTPLALYYAVFHGKNTVSYRLFLKIIIALTFIGHGLYAMGYYAVPANFQQMIVNFFGISEISARQLLIFAAYADFAIAIAIFLPYLKSPFLLYAIFWGTATALARVVANLQTFMLSDGINQAWFEMAYRLPHGGIPLVLWLLLREKNKRLFKFCF
ncbi:MAG: hypothetical protein ACPG5B_06265 [Chitinophagales bacterium]